MGRTTLACTLRHGPARDLTETGWDAGDGLKRLFVDPVAFIGQAADHLDDVANAVVALQDPGQFAILHAMGDVEIPDRLDDRQGQCRADWG